MAKLIIERKQVQDCARECKSVSRVLWHLAPRVDPSLRGPCNEARKKLDRIRAFLEHIDQQIEEARTDPKPVPKPVGKAEKGKKGVGELVVSDSPRITKEALEGLGE